MGLGLGGFVDGIVLHQILQWHHMLTDTWDHPMTTVAGLEANTLADGFFHLATWVLVATAMLLTVRAWLRRELAPPWRRHFGCVAGSGVFNVAEGLSFTSSSASTTSAMTSADLLGGISAS